MVAIDLDYVQGTRLAADTYDGNKPSGTGAANLGLVAFDCHVPVVGFGTAGLYS